MNKQYTAKKGAFWSEQYPEYSIYQGNEYIAGPMPQEHAAYIVKCVNQHEQLVSALKAAKIFLIDDNYYQEAKHLIATIDAALGGAE